MSTINLTVSGAKVRGYTAVGNLTTDAFEFEHSHAWSFDISESGTDGTPTYTIECSNDGVKWYEYDVNAVGCSIDCAYKFSSFEFRYFRVVYTATGVTVGTITMNLTINNIKTY